MKKLFYFLLIAFSYSMAQENTSGLKEFAKLNSVGFSFTIDTLKFKNQIKQSIVSNSGDYEFDEIKIKAKTVLGKENLVVYCFVLKSKAKKLTVSRALKRIDDTLFLNDKIEDDTFELYYQVCQSKENIVADCDSNIFYVDDKLFWGCGTDPKCVAPGFELPCNGFKTVILPN